MLPKEYKACHIHASARSLTWSVEFCTSVLKPKDSEGAQSSSLSLYKIISLTFQGLRPVLIAIATAISTQLPVSKNECGYQNISEVINKI